MARPRVCVCVSPACVCVYELRSHVWRGPACRSGIVASVGSGALGLRAASLAKWRPSFVAAARGLQVGG